MSLSEKRRLCEHHLTVHVNRYGLDGAAEECDPSDCEICGPDPDCTCGAERAGLDHLPTCARMDPRQCADVDRCPVCDEPCHASEGAADPNQLTGMGTNDAIREWVADTMDAARFGSVVRRPSLRSYGVTNPETVKAAQSELDRAYVNASRN